ncbi:Histidine phosphatase superfamily clade-1 [Penicillium bovifimosum]|uniref:Histidine phosphatase superfamily clade-1 n=1 Tax=Penicillium bovifimosum TaxID=126998 RepID=A0A9W9H417_9EURO|nr:Histidine phosphatase superfamily clade-1 [Penicillium bovifimosum]KAJ5138227.1 Histidine phosphatase superfamily clade-1 [Penicillium bovifimosum]
MQSRALGVRIGSLLRARQFTGEDPVSQRSHDSTSDDQAKANPASSDLSHRYNVIIHTSPFLRCLQTAIGVSAGINQQHPDTEASEATSSAFTVPETSSIPDRRCLLRVDAFLGEWLSPDYYDQITPPPGSDRMVASAKAELLRRAEAIPATDGSPRALSGNFPGGWGSQSQPTSPSENEDRRVRPATTQRQRASTHNTLQSPSQMQDGKERLLRLNTDLSPDVVAHYVPPTPNYAVSNSDPIPTGYVAHARNACTKIDYQWDSMRTPYWGTGGEFGEEWGTMHERVHDGFQHMINWYREQGQPKDDSIAAKSSGETTDNAQTILVIITHGADCNALISSLSGHSVLLDINTASLTMAVRSNRVNQPTRDEDPQLKYPDPDDQSVSQEYSLQIVASTDHLRPGINPSQLTSLLSSSAKVLSPPPVPSYRNRLGARPSLPQGTSTNRPPSSGSTSPRAWTLAMRPPPNSRGISGLWNSVPSADKTDDFEDNYVPDFGDRSVSQDSALSSRPVVDRGWTKQLPQRTLSQRGLWGSAQSLGEREGGTKRRWTVTEQNL